jgi:hypothetical protein
MISGSLGKIPQVYSGVTYKTVELSNVGLEMDESSELISVFPDGDRAQLTPFGFESLCESIQVPLRFARRLKQEGKSHVLAYLQKQLARAYSAEPVIAVVRDKRLESVTLDNLLPYKGMDITELDDAITRHCSDETCKVSWTGRSILGNDVVYDFVQGQQKIDADPDGSEWQFGYSFHYSIIGSELPYFTAFAVRKSNMARMEFPERRFRHKLSRNKRYGTAVDSMLEYLSDLPPPNWDILNGYVKKLVSIPASMRELKEVRNRLVRALKIDKEDKATAERIDKSLYWNEIVSEYGLKDLEVKPTRNWYMRASTPHTLWYVYDVLIRETTHAPNDLAFESRKKLHAYSAKLLDRVPDLAEKTPNVTWKGFKIHKA